MSFLDLDGAACKARSADLAHDPGYAGDYTSFGDYVRYFVETDTHRLMAPQPCVGQAPPGSIP